MKTNKNQWQDDAALKRYTMIAPLLTPALIMPDVLLSVKRSRKTTTQQSVPCTVTKRPTGKTVLQDCGRRTGKSSAARQLPDNFQELLSEAVQLCREVPERSVEQIILILELANRMTPGVVRRSTQERHLFDAGFGAEHMRAYKKARESSSRRFCKPHRMMLLQDDIKYGPSLPHREKTSKCKNLSVLRNR